MIIFLLIGNPKISSEDKWRKKNVLNVPQWQNKANKQKTHKKKKKDPTPFTKKPKPTKKKVLETVKIFCLGIKLSLKVHFQLLPHGF